MNFWLAFAMAAMPIAKVFITCGVGAYLGHPKTNILTTDARKLLNKLVVVAFTPAFVFANLVKSVSFQNILKWWYMPLNVIFCFTCGIGLGMLLLKYTNVPDHLRNLVLACCAAGNTGNVPLVLIPTICEEQEDLFGDSQTCARNAVAYVSYGMWMGIALMWTIGYKLLQPPNFQHKEPLPGFGSPGSGSRPNPPSFSILGAGQAPVSSVTPSPPTIPVPTSVVIPSTESAGSAAYSRNDFGDFQGGGIIGKMDGKAQAKTMSRGATGTGDPPKLSAPQGARSSPSQPFHQVGVNSGPGSGLGTQVGSQVLPSISSPPLVKKLATPPPPLQPASSNLKLPSAHDDMIGINLSSSPTSSSSSPISAASSYQSINAPQLTTAPLAYLSFIVEKYDIKTMLNPPTCAAILGLIVGGIPPLKSLAEGPFLVFMQSASLIGQAMLPTMNMVLGASMVQERGVSELEMPAVVGIISVRLVVLPIIGIISIGIAKGAGMLPLDPLFKFVLLLQFTMPTAINVGTLSQLFCVGEKESAIVLFYAYLSATFFITFWIMIYLGYLL